MHHRSLVATLTLFTTTLSILLTGSTACSRAQTNGPFVEKPYLQLGNAPTLLSNERLSLLWHTSDTDEAWAVDVQLAGATTWKRMKPPQFHRVAVAGVAPHRVWTATLEGLKPGTAFTYRVLKGTTPLFTARATARKTPAQPYTFVVFGDCAQNTPGQRAVAYQTYQAKPHFVFITGDIVYSRGRASEYQEKYFPIYNADEASPTTGAPLLRSTVFLASPGNHDILGGDFNSNPDTFAYYYYWAQPLNGPALTPGGPNTPRMSGDDANQKAFLTAAGEAFPRMANFSFDYGNSHWTVLDANPHVDWTDPALRAWVEKDLAAARRATWRFVAFHQPGFNSAKDHLSEQRMRLLSDIFEQGKVDIVFAGHVHNYQRTYPLKFAISRNDYGIAEATHQANGPIGGEWTLDRAFDGDKNTRPDGVIYIVTGGGGAGLYNPEQQNKPETWQPFTLRFIADTHSLTRVDIDGKTLTLRQIAGSGTELDRITIKK